ncbi:MAG: hypothetical protein NZ898_07600 [Myxococcota bacterium]|nr:hypothetical protein [Myxococcota bacterium]
MHDVLDRDEVDRVLREQFFRPERAQTPRLQPPGPEASAAADQAQPDRPRRRSSRVPPNADYEIISISLYREDLDRLDAMVAALRRAGHRKMSRSALIRFALDHVDPSRMPRSY